MMMTSSMPPPPSPVSLVITRERWSRSGGSSMVRGGLVLPCVAPPPSQTRGSQISRISSISGDSHQNVHHPLRSGGRNHNSVSPFVVLHGRVLRSAPSLSENVMAPVDEGVGGLGRVDDRSPGAKTTSSSYKHHSSLRSFKEQPGTVRESMQRKSKYYELRQDVQGYRKQVESLGQLLRQFIAVAQLSTPNGSHRYYKPEPEPSPTDAWRLRILVKSAVDTDKTLWGKLYEYERSLKDKEEQNSCVRLHRDFKRIHNGLVMCLSLIDEHRSNHPVLRQLGGVGWARVISQPDEPLKEEIDEWMPQMQNVDSFEFQDRGSSQRATIMEYGPEEIEPQPIEAMDLDPSDRCEPVEFGLMVYDADEGEESLLDTKYEESLTDTKTTQTHDFTSIGDRTFEEEGESPFACLPTAFSCDYMNRDEDKNGECLSVQSKWAMTFKMLRHDMRAVQRGIARSWACGKA